MHHDFQFQGLFHLQGLPLSRRGLLKAGGALVIGFHLGEAPSPAYVSDFLATSDGLALTKAFVRIADAKLRRRIVDLVEQIAGEE